MTIYNSPVKMPAGRDSPTSVATSDDDSIRNGGHNGYTSTMLTDDPYQPMPPTSPTSITTADDEPPMSPQDQTIQMFKSQQRRPGLGVTLGEESPRSTLPNAVVAREALGYTAKDSLECELVAGEVVHLLTRPFYDELCAWLDTNDASAISTLGPVDNTDLFEYFEDITRPGRMRIGLRLGEDFVLVSSKTWQLLMEWFGGGPCITRKCVNDNGRVVIDVRGIELKVKRSSRPTKFMRHVFSVYDTVGYMKRVVIDEWINVIDSFEPGTYRIWDYMNDKCVARMHPDSAQLASFKLIDGQSIMFEEADPRTGEFRWDPETGEDNSNSFLSTSNVSAFSTTPSYLDQRRRRPENAITSSRMPVTPGAVGLSNLGNTCFMNSTLQCLSNIWLLRNRFVSDEYEADINTSNPLGTGGKLARSFGDLMKLIWGNRGDVVSPMGFKSVMAEFKPEFSGYQQHDSQELLSFLLDGLHEDLNRVKNKPFTQAVEANGRPDHEVAADSCRVHRLRNDSFVNDLFEGFYKSTVICPDCQKVSVTFDPFTLVQLPVSRPKQTKLVTFPIAVLNSETGLPFRSSPTYVKVAHEAYLYEVRTKACSNQSPEATPEDFIVCSVYRDKIHHIFTDFDKIDRVASSDDLIAFYDKNASKVRLIQELETNGTWHRSLLAPSVDYASMDLSEDFVTVNPEACNVEDDVTFKVSALPHSAPSCPFGQGDIWIGTLENRRYRARMQVCEVSEYGPWVRLLGFRVKCILDVAQTSTGAYYEKREGIEEVACEIVGYVRDLQSSSIGDTLQINCLFEQSKYLGMFGSYVGDVPMLTEDRLPLGLIGSCPSRNFFAGQVVEQQARRHFNSFHSQVKEFTFIRWDQDVVSPSFFESLKKAIKEPLVQGPQRPVNPDAIAVVTIQQRKSYENVGQPSAFTVPIFTTSKELYDIIIERLNKRIQVRLGSNVVRMEEVDGMDMSDPFHLRNLFRLVQKFAGTTYTRVLDETDSDTLVVPETAESYLPLLMFNMEWDAVKLSDENGPLFDALFGSLYTEENSDEDGKRMTRLYDCFDMFSEEEKLSSTETWYCSNCKGHKEAFKKMELWQVPPVLVIHLKRFSQSQTSYFVDKDDTEIDFPLEGLDLRDRVRNSAAKDDCIYDLVAVSHHYGGLGGGHYIAHARNEADGNWYEFDDSCVRLLGTTSAAAAHKVKGSSAYVLMYVKRSYTADHWGHGRQNNNIVVDDDDDVDLQPADEFTVNDALMNPAYDDVGVV